MIAAKDKTLASLRTLQVWLGECQARLPTAEWERLRIALEAALTALGPFIASQDWTAAEQVITAFAERYRIGEGLESSRIDHSGREPAPRDDGSDSWQLNKWGRRSSEERNPRPSADLADTLRSGGRPGPTGLRGEPRTTTRGTRGEANPGYPYRPRETTRSGESHAGGELLRDISRLLRFRRDVPIVETIPELRFPEKVREQTTFQVLVCTQQHQTPYSGEKVAFERPADGPLDVEIQLVVAPNGGLVLRSPGEAVLRLDAAGCSAAICFEVFATAPGEQRFEVAFRSGGIERVRMEGRVEVLPPAASDPVGPFAALTLISGRLMPSAGFTGLLLQLEPQGISADFRSYHVVLSGTAWSGPPMTDSILLPADCTTLLADLCRDMTGVAQLEDAAVRESRLRNIGQALARSVLPPRIADALLRSSFPPGTPLHIESGIANVPWESLWVGDASSGRFLGEHFAVTRYPRLGQPRDLVGGASAMLVAPQGAGLAFSTEREALTVLTGTRPQELSRLAQLHQLLSGARPCSVLHFACHGDAAAKKSFGNLLQLDGGTLVEADVAPPQSGQRGPLDGSLIFINACRANMSYPSLWGHEGWTGVFLRAGVGALIAPAWTVSDIGAARFAEVLYHGAATGLSLGEAARLARVRMADEDPSNPDRLGYAVIASPSTRHHPAAVSDPPGQTRTSL